MQQRNLECVLKRQTQGNKTPRRMAKIIGALAIALLANANAQVMVTPAGQNLNGSCMGNPKPIEHLIDLDVGKGQPASKEQAVFVRLTKWNYDPKAKDFKGAPSGFKTQVYDFPAYGKRRFEGAAMQYILDGIIPVEGASPMRVGGKRTIVVPCGGDVIEIELAEVAASKNELKANAGALQAPPPAIADAYQREAERNQRTIADEARRQIAAAQRFAPALKNSEEDKRYCNEQVQKHLSVGGQTNVANIVFSGCMQERLAIARGRLAQAERERTQAELKQQHLQDAAQICPAGAQPPSAASSTESTLYGLAVNMPMLCLHFCSDVGEQETRMCVADNYSFGKTAWDTTSFTVIPSYDVFGYVGTGNPRVEIVDGKIVGISFENSVFTPQEWLQELTKKFGKYQLRSSDYVWETSASSAHLVPKQELSAYTSGSFYAGDLELHQELVARATFSVYVPAVRARKKTYDEAYEAAEELKNRKEKF